MQVFFLIVALLLVSLPSLAEAAPPSHESLQKRYNVGEYKEVLADVKERIFSDDFENKELPADLQLAVSCFNSLGKQSEFDELLEKAVEKHSGNWQALKKIAELYQSANHHGFIVSGKFQRGSLRGRGRWVDSTLRDRTRALQLLSQAEKLALEHARDSEIASFYESYANSLKAVPLWRLSHKTDLTKLPEFDESANRYSSLYNLQNGATPVDASGEPLYFDIPSSFTSAKNDGERWRWALARAIQFEARRSGRIELQLAHFFRELYGVRTLGNRWQIFARNEQKNEGERKAAIFALDTLEETETIARLANGIKRFAIPEQYNFIAIFKRLSETSSEYSVRADALKGLAEVFQDRRQFTRAVPFWEKAIKEVSGKSDYRRDNFQEQLDQIVGAWGRFEPRPSSAAGGKADFEFRFRNAKSVSFEAHQIDIERLIGDVKNHIKKNPAQFDWQKVELSNLGYRIFHKNEKQYLGSKVASWKERLSPHPDHTDKRLTLSAPIEKAGAYLITAKVAGGNTSNIIIWLSDAVIVKKPIDEKTLYFVADAKTGAPLAGVKLDIFGYQRKYLSRGGSAPGKPNHKLLTVELSKTTDRNGMVALSVSKEQRRFRWLVTTTRSAGVISFLGFGNHWHNARSNYQHRQKKGVFITNQPVYRPGQTAKFKGWLRLGGDIVEDYSYHPEQTITVEIHNPRNEKIYKQQHQLDKYGGLHSSVELPKDATLGEYRISMIGYPAHGKFRVEEYKKPEFEVKIDGADKPVELGETIRAKIRARYYFGEPVKKAKVRYQVFRKPHVTQWYPIRPWDWLYGRGYWWFSYDHDWLPGWRNWGCRRPIPGWWHRPSPPPELVQENLVDIGADGTAEVVIDTKAAKEIHGDSDQEYEIRVEVVDESRRMIAAQGSVIAARKPFEVFAWLSNGYLRAGQSYTAYFQSQSADGKPVSGAGEARLFRLSYDKTDSPKEKLVKSWKLRRNAEGRAEIRLQAKTAGQYRISYLAKDSAGREVEGAYVFVVYGKNLSAKELRFRELELVPFRAEYQPGDKLEMLLGSAQENSTVLLFIRPSNGIYPQPKLLRLSDKSKLVNIDIKQNDMPNFFVEALSVQDGKVLSEIKEIVVPPEKRVLEVSASPSAEKYQPGETAKVQLKVLDSSGKPFVGSLVVAVYDKALEYISGGSNVPDLKSYFWKWRRNHYPVGEHSIPPPGQVLTPPKTTPMRSIGFFGNHLFAQGYVDIAAKGANAPRVVHTSKRAVADLTISYMESGTTKEEARENAPATAPPPPPVVHIRRDFRDSVFWKAELETNKKGIANVEFPLPENLTTWKIRTWAMGKGTRVGQAENEIITSKDLLVRPQTPRFLVEGDRVILSSNIHNYTSSPQSLISKFEYDGSAISLEGDASKRIALEANDEQRVDWQVSANREGEAVVRMLALGDVESDAAEVRFPVQVHGIERTESFSGALRSAQQQKEFSIVIPEKRRVEQSRLELRFSPSIAAALVDALPYLANYPYGCTEQTLNRFLPTVITQNIISKLGVDLSALRTKVANLNPQELGLAPERAKQWRRWKENPVYNQEKLEDMAKVGLQRLSSMQLSDGGWGWFSGHGEHSSPHTTAYVMRGLLIAKEQNTEVDPNTISRGLIWLENYRASELQKRKNAETKTKPYKHHMSNLDAFVELVLSSAGKSNKESVDYLFQDRTKISIYANAMLGLVLDSRGEAERVQTLLKFVEQYLREDDENQTAYLELPNNSYWWYWYGSEYEAHAFYLKLLSRIDPNGQKASRIAKYLLNNRRHSTYWNSTRDTALVIEALADYLEKSKELQSNGEVEVLLNGKSLKKVSISPENLFLLDNSIVLEGEALSAGTQKVSIKKAGDFPLYYNAYSRNFTLEDQLEAAGLELKVRRKLYRLVRNDQSVAAPDAKGGAATYQKLSYDRLPLPDLSSVNSGDLIEIELEIESKNDYEYLIIEDRKAAGMEPLEVRSGYLPNELNAYVEFRDDRVAFFLKTLARGRHSLSYRMRAEIPGTFSALPTKIYAMYAPELIGNSKKNRISISDR